MSVVTWYTYGESDYGYITSENSGVLGEDFEINVYMQYNHMCKIYATPNYASDRQLIYSGYGGTTVHWTPPISDCLNVTNVSGVTYNLSFEFSEDGTAARTYQYGYSGNLTFTIPIYPKVISLIADDTTNCYATFGKYVQNNSKIRMELVANIDSSYGVPITKAQFKINDVWITVDDFTKDESGNYTCSYEFTPTIAGKNQLINAVVSDQRGVSTYHSVYINVLAYEPPSVTVSYPYRCDVNGNALYNGSYACVTINATACSADSMNSLTAKLNWIASSTSTADCSSEYTADSSMIISNQKVIFLVSNDEEYIIYAQCSDKINSTNSLNRRLQKVSPMLDIDRSNNALGFGTLAKDPNTACFGPRAIFEQGGVFDDTAMFNQFVTFEAGSNLPMYGENLLDNSDFRNPINQGICSSEFVLDRWHGDCTITISTTDKYITVPSGGKIWQVIPSKSTVIHGDGSYVYNVNLFNLDGTFTLSAMTVDGSIHILTGTFSNAPSNNLMSMNSDYSVTLKPGSYKWVALYEGSYNEGTLPAYRTKGFVNELNRCKQFCQTLKRAGVGYYIYSNGTYVGGVRKESYKSIFTYPLDVPMFPGGTVVTDRLSYPSISVDYITDSIPSPSPITSLPDSSGISVYHMYSEFSGNVVLIYVTHYEGNYSSTSYSVTQYKCPALISMSNIILDASI